MRAGAPHRTGCWPACKCKDLLGILLTAFPNSQHLLLLLLPTQERRIALAAGQPVPQDLLGILLTAADEALLHACHMFMILLLGCCCMRAGAPYSTGCWPASPSGPAGHPADCS